MDTFSLVLVVENYKWGRKLRVLRVTTIVPTTVHKCNWKSWLHIVHYILFSISPWYKLMKHTFQYKQITDIQNPDDCWHTWITIFDIPLCNENTHMSVSVFSVEHCCVPYGIICLRSNSSKMRVWKSANLLVYCYQLAFQYAYLN